MRGPAPHPRSTRCCLRAHGSILGAPHKHQLHLGCPNLRRRGGWTAPPVARAPGPERPTSPPTPQPPGDQLPVASEIEAASLEAIDILKIEQCIPRGQRNGRCHSSAASNLPASHPRPRPAPETPDHPLNPTTSPPQRSQDRPTAPVPIGAPTTPRKTATTHPASLRSTNSQLSPNSTRRRPTNPAPAAPTGRTYCSVQLNNSRPQSRSQEFANCEVADLGRRTAPQIGKSEFRAAEAPEPNGPRPGGGPATDIPGT